MNDRDRKRFEDMLGAAREAFSFISGKSCENLTRDRILFLALVKEIEIVGEAGAQISAETRSAFPRSPWPAIIGMRNQVIHAYRGIDCEIVWSRLTQDLPPLAVELEKILRD